MQDTTYEDDTYPTAEDNESPEEEVRLLSTVSLMVPCSVAVPVPTFGIVLVPVPNPDHI
jgi:hypothetical protein